MRMGAGVTMLYRESIDGNGELTVQFRLGQDHVRNAFFDELGGFFRRGCAMNWAFFGFTSMNLPSFLSKARPDIFKIRLHVVVYAQEHLLELSGRWGCGRDFLGN